jgi:photosystem II stability/assembly factor-like uncharacterized protein
VLQPAAKVNSLIKPSATRGRLDEHKVKRLLLQSFEADREAGRPFHFYARSFFMFIFQKSGSFISSMSRLRICPDSIVRRGGLLLGIAVVLSVLLVPALAAQSLWNAVGPAGGDARSFAMVPGNPSHLYLGTTNSWVYESLDEGVSWHRLAKLDSEEDTVLDSILVDSAHPGVLFAGGWKPDQHPGGLYVSRDGGKHWSAVESMRTQSIFSIAQSPSQPNMIVVGTLQGVYRSDDAGMTWTLISPPGSHEIHEVESLAIDPVDANIVYAGTWHLPWKTIDGGQHWHNIKNGVIEDSDVFSMIIDPTKPHIVYLSACSGIYKSENAGELFHKIQGIPSTARRTRVLMQDPSHHEVVYAGTTEGLYKTQDNGKTFQRMTGPEVVVNDVFVDPADSNHVLLAIDRGGVLSSQDAGVSFTPSNGGFSGRRVEALLVDQANPATMYAGVVNDKSYGGAFVSTNGGISWDQVGEGPGGGLAGRDVFSLAQAKDGTIVAGTGHGIFVLATTNQQAEKAPSEHETPASPGPQSSEALSPALDKPVWLPRNTISNTSAKTIVETHHGQHVDVEKRVVDPAFELQSRVNALNVSGDVWLASTGFGLLTSQDQGATWQGGAVMASNGYLSVASHGGTMAAARPDGVVFSTDAGTTWMPMGIPATLTRIRTVAFSGDGTIWLGAREGVYFSHDQGKTWLWIGRLPFSDVDDLYYDQPSNRVLVSSRTSEQIYAINAKTLKWEWWQTGYRIGLVRTAAGRVVAASLFDGVLVEPQAALANTAQK